MIIVTLISPTGGTGRTSLAVSLASHLHALGRHVVLVQADPQNNIEYHLGHTAASEHGLGNFLLHPEQQDSLLQTQAESALRHLPFGQLNIPQILTVDRVLLEHPDRLTSLFKHPEFEDDCIVVVDLPRWPSTWCHQVLALSDLNLVTMVPDSNSVLSIDKLMPSLLQSRGASYFLMNRFDSSKVLHLDLWTLCKMKLSHRLLPFYLHEDQALPESVAAGMPLQEYAPHSQLVEDVQKLCNWIDQEIG